MMFKVRALSLVILLHKESVFGAVVVATALCFRLRLPFCGCKFESQAHHLCFFQLYYWSCDEKRTKIKKEVRIGPFFKKKHQENKFSICQTLFSACLWKVLFQSLRNLHPSVEGSRRRRCRCHYRRLRRRRRCRANVGSSRRRKTSRERRRSKTSLKTVSSSRRQRFVGNVWKVWKLKSKPNLKTTFLSKHFKFFFFSSFIRPKICLESFAFSTQVGRRLRSIDGYN